MSAYLLDVNTLIALAWDDHVHHQLAHEWFSSNEEAGFATCHVSQSGFLRLSLNQSVVGFKITTQDAIATLDTITSRPRHEFWEDGPVETTSPIWATVTTYKHVPDINLYLIARRHRGTLVTFDSAIRNRVPTDERQWVQLIEA